MRDFLSLIGVAFTIWFCFQIGYSFGLAEAFAIVEAGLHD